VYVHDFFFNSLHISYPQIVFGSRENTILHRTDGVFLYIKKKKPFWLEKVLTLSADYRFSCGRNAGIKLHKH